MSFIPPQPFARSMQELCGDGDFCYTALSNDAGTERYGGEFSRSSFRSHLPAAIDFREKRVLSSGQKRNWNVAFDDEEDDSDDSWWVVPSKVIIHNYQENAPKISLFGRGEKTPFFSDSLPKNHYQSHNQLLRGAFDLVKQQNTRREINPKAVFYLTLRTPLVQEEFDFFLWNNSSSSLLWRKVTPSTLQKGDAIPAFFANLTFENAIAESVTKTDPTIVFQTIIGGNGTAYVGNEYAEKRSFPFGAIFNTPNDKPFGLILHSKLAQRLHMDSLQEFGKYYSTTNGPIPLPTWGTATHPKTKKTYTTITSPTSTLIYLRPLNRSQTVSTVSADFSIGEIEIEINSTKYPFSEVLKRETDGSVNDLLSAIARASSLKFWENVSEGFDFENPGNQLPKTKSFNLVATGKKEFQNPTKKQCHLYFNEDTLQILKLDEASNSKLSSPVNGIYSLQLDGSSKVVFSPAILSQNSFIDRKKPQISSHLDCIREKVFSQEYLLFQMKFDSFLEIRSQKDEKIILLNGKTFGLFLKDFVATERYEKDVVCEMDLALSNVEQETITLTSRYSEELRRERILASCLDVDPSKKLVEISPKKERNARRLRRNLYKNREFTLRDVVDGNEKQFWTGGVAVCLTFFKNYLDW